MVNPSIFAPYLSLLLPAGIVAATVMAWWAAILPRLSIGLLIFSLAAGQVVRFPLPGQGGGILLSDIGVALVLLSAVVQLFRNSFQKNSKFEYPNFASELRWARRNSKQTKMTKIENFKLVSDFGFRISCLFIILLLWSLFTLTIQMPQLGLEASLVSLSYWLRLAAHLLLLPAMLVLCRDENIRLFTRKAFVVSVGALVVFGFVQLVFLPNLGDLSRVAPLLGGAKWDPHQSRLTSTWLDPNFFGAFLVIVLPFLLVKKKTMRHASLAPRSFRRRRSEVGYFLLLAAVAATVLTQSRSSLVALVGATAVASPFWLMRQRLQPFQAMRYVSIGGFFVVILLMAGFLLGERFVSLWQYDPTVDLRAQSLRLIWHDLVQPHALLGVGYNAYQFAALEADLIDDFSIHSRAGADNSWLTLWVTTGLPGVFLFALPWAYLMVCFMTRWFKEKHSLSLAAVFSLLALFIHSQFINSFLYSHLLIVLIIIISLAFSDHLGMAREVRNKT